MSRAGEDRDTLEYEPGPRLDSLEYVVVDVETTGGSPERGHRITEVAGLRVDATGRILEEFRTLVNPLRRIPPFVSRLTNITQDMVRRAPVFDEVAPELALLLEGRVFVAHNAAFDWRFVSSELGEAGWTPAAGARVLCTVKLARRVVPELRRRSLDSLARYFGIEIEDRHRAYGDARATVEVFRRLFQRLEERDVLSWNGLETLLARRAAARPKRTSLPTWMDAAEATDLMQ